MATFSEFLSSFDPTAGKRGKQFEHFIKWFLKNDPEWATQVDQVWLWEEYPQSWGRDCGIDLVFKHKNGENWAVQAKCYAPTTSITKADVDSFISESNRDGIDKLLLIATTDLIGANAKQVCDAQDKKVTRYLLSHFDESNIEYPASIEDLSKAKPKDKPKPREHQLEAIEAVTSNFKDTDRGQMIMACGTGKTITTLWIKEKLGVDSTLVLLPSLGLLSQTLHEWTMAANEPFEVLCVCSDESVGKKGSDEAVHSVHDLAFPVTSNSAEIKVFLDRSGKKVIFSTYQSSPLIAEAQVDPSTSPFDLAIADEAHRCAGKVSGDFSTILDAQKIRAKKRLFTTATPRTYSSNVKKAAEDRGVEVVGMDDEAVFGKQFFALNFGEAIKRGLLTDYRVVIIGVDDPTISALIENRELLKADSDIEMDAESLASQVGLLKAMKDYDLYRMISFHSRVSRAEEFSKDIHKVVDWIDEKHKPSGELKSDFVSGEMPTDKRRKKLAQLKGLQDNQRGLLTNARCLSEGVDVPSLDGVAFIDPRGSQIDIIQAVGRAIRLSTNKQAGTIVLPVFIANSDDPEKALEDSNFKSIWEVLNALKAHDDVLADELNQIRTELGRKGGGKVDPDAFSKITIDLPVGIDKSFGDGLRTLLVERSTDSWEFWFGLLVKYKEENGDCEVVSDYITPEGFKLRTWINNQRNINTKLPIDRFDKLEKLGFVWSPFDKQWEEGFNALKKFYLREGHCVTNGSHIEDSYKLGQWANVQRSIKKKNLSLERISRLDELKFPWDLIDQKWEEGFSNLRSYFNREGNSSPPARYKESEYSLGQWVSRQRQYKDKLNDNQLFRLNKLKFDWDPISSDWERHFTLLVKYQNLNGHCLPAKRDLFEGVPLGYWVSTQRITKESMTEDRRNRLEQIGFVWDVKDKQWEEGFKKLQEFKKREGHCLVLRGHIEDGFQLSTWVSTQRYHKESIGKDRIALLNEIGFIWDVNESVWNEGFEYLLKFIKREGHARVPARHKEENYPLGSWAARQRKNVDSNLRRVPDSRKQKLDDVGFIWEM